VADLEIYQSKLNSESQWLWSSMWF
jgi:hypothetical protein